MVDRRVLPSSTGMKTNLLQFAALALLTGCGATTFSIAEPDASDPPDAGHDADPRADTGKPDTGQDTGHSCTSCKLDAGSDAGHEHVKDPDAGHDAGEAPDAGSDSHCCLGADAGEDVSTHHLDAGKDSSEPDVKTGSDSGHTDGGLPEDAGHTVDADEDSGHDAGKDSAPVCEYTTPKCSGNILLTCGDGGTVAIPCAGSTPICLELAGVGTCVPCAPGTGADPNTQCANDTAGYYSDISTCSPEGQWVTQKCDPATPVCSGPSGTAACGGVCVPGSTQCGREYNGPNAGTGGPFCPNGASCSCFGSPQYEGIEECDNTGHWAYASDCVPGGCSSGFYCTMVAGQGVCPAT